MSARERGGQPVSAMGFAGSPWFAHKPGSDGQPVPVTRVATCACGAEFRQAMLSARVMEAVERRGREAMREFRRQIPELYVPVLCPSCERRAIAAEARTAEAVWQANHPAPRTNWRDVPDSRLAAAGD